MNTLRSSRLLATHPRFTAIRSTEVLRPKFLPPIYSWMQPGQYATYSGQVTLAWDPQTRAMAKTSLTADWGWEIDYVRGVPPMDPVKMSVERLSKEDICLGYTLYVDPENRGIDHFLRHDVLFVCFFQIPASMDGREIKTSNGVVRCFGTKRVRQAFDESMDYERRTSVLIQTTFLTLDGTPIYASMLSDTNIRMS